MASVYSKEDLSFKGCALVPITNLINAISMVVKVFGCSMEVKVLEKLDKIRGDIPRAKFKSQMTEKLEVKD